MEELTREQLIAYLEESLGESDMSRIEKELRKSEPARARLLTIREELDRGEHSLGAIWRREGISCPTREQLNGFLHQAHDDDFMAYIDFHLKVVTCPRCLANLEDLRERQAGVAEHTRRRQKIYDSSRGLLPGS